MTGTVRQLEYEVIWSPDVDYEKAPPIHIKTDDFDLGLCGRELTAALKRNVATIDEARSCVEEYLRGWELLIGIREHLDAVRFVYKRAEVEEESVDPEMRQRVRHAKAAIEASGAVTAVPHVSRGKYPLPVDPFRVDAIVEAMYSRYRRYQDGRELLLSMANFCLSVLLESSGKEKGKQKRAAAAWKYSIDEEVLSKLGNICANKGAEYEARKAPPVLSFTPLSQAEEKWVLGVVKAMILRAGELAAVPDKQYPKIKMLNLPDLGCN